MKQLHKFGFGTATATIGILMLVAISFAIGGAGTQVYAERTLLNLEHERFRASSFAKMIQVSSDNLTTFSRNYVVTGDPIYLKYFQQVLDIRNGEAPIPADYNEYYWKFVLGDENVSDQVLTTEQAHWHELAEREGFTPAEIDKLNEAYVNSEELARMEDEAMALTTEASRELNQSEFYNDPRVQKAVQMLHSNEYNKQKAIISRPLAEFNLMWSTRIASSIEKFGRISQVAGIIFMISLLVICGILASVYYSIVKPILALAIAIKKRSAFKKKPNGFLGTREIEALVEDYNSLLSNLRAANKHAVDQLKELEKSYEKLSQSNIDLEISEFKLARKTENLQVAVDELNMFMRITSHDLSAPIKNIAALSDVLAQQSAQLDEAAKARFVDNISKSANRLLKLIGDLRALTKLDAQDLQLDTSDANSMFEAVISEYKSDFEIQKAEYFGRTANSKVEGYGSLIRQLFENLIRNALLHGSNPANITLEHDLVEGDHTFRMINSCREGFVFDDSVVKPFKRGSDTSAEGTGLGLYICRKIVELHNGEVRVFKTPENEFGVEFSIRRTNNVNIETERQRAGNSGG